MEIRNVVVAGGGVLGSQIAFQVAFCGFPVTIWLREECSIAHTQPKLDKLKSTYIDTINQMASSDGKTLDKVNLTLNFRVKLLVGIDTSVINNIKNSIKVYIENINTINPSMHMYNLTTSIKDEYKSEIEFVEFVGINDYNALLSYLKNNNIGSNHEDISDVPEFLCVNLLNGNTPDINIDIV